MEEINKLFVYMRLGKSQMSLQCIGDSIMCCKVVRVNFDKNYVYGKVIFNFNFRCFFIFKTFQPTMKNLRSLFFVVVTFSTSITRTIIRKPYFFVSDEIQQKLTILWILM